MTDTIAQIRQAIVEGDEDGSVEETRAAIEAGIDPMRILNESLMAGADQVGQLFEAGEYYLPELMMTGRALKAAMDIIRPELQEKYSGGEGQVKGKIILATIQTDIHDLGKNIVSSMLMAAGFEVTDLGVDVPLKTIIDKAEETQADVIALSCLLTTSMPYTQDLIELLKARNLRSKYIVLVGGASVTPEWAKAIGADGTADNAIAAVRLVRQLLGMK